MKEIAFKSNQYFLNNNLISQGVILAEIKNFTQDLYQDELDKIILFGSRARGDNKPDSDVDILIVLKNDFNYSKEIQKTSNCIGELSLKFDVVISRVFAKTDDLIHNNTPFFMNVRKEGIVL